DAELERARRDERAKASGLEIVLDPQTLLARDGAVMRVRELLAREVVHRVRDALGEAAAVHEDERRAVRAHELEQARVDRGPDAGAGVGTRRGPAAELERL